MQRVFFGDVNAATVRVLAAEGFEVHAPRAPRCCGALQLHAGDEDEAPTLARGDDRGLRGLRHVVVNAAGCGSAMKDYGHLLATTRVGRARRGVRREGPRRDRAAGRARAARRRQPAPLQRRLPRRLPPGPRPGRAQPAARAAARDPRARAASSPPSGRSAAARPASTTCCSPRPRPSSARRKADEPAATGAEAIAAANPGCALQIAAHTAGRVPVYHPMSCSTIVRDPRRIPMSTVRRHDRRAAATTALDEILTDDALALRRRAARALRRRAAQELLAARASASADSTPAARSTSSRDARRSARATGRVAPPPADLQDRRVEITGPTDRKMVINALNSGAERLHGRLRGLQLADLAAT